MDFYEKYSFIFEDEKLYSSPVWREAYTNYRNRGNNDPLDIFADAIGKSIADTVNHIFSRKRINKVVKDIVIKNGGEWTDD